MTELWIGICIFSIEGSLSYFNVIKERSRVSRNYLGLFIYWESSQRIIIVLRLIKEKLLVIYSCVHIEF